MSTARYRLAGAKNSPSTLSLAVGGETGPGAVTAATEEFTGPGPTTVTLSGS